MAGVHRWYLFVKENHPLCFVMFLMIETRKHSLQEAARFWDINKSRLFHRIRSDLFSQNQINGSSVMPILLTLSSSFAKDQPYFAM